MGRTVRIGDLYDARSDTFCGSMLKSEIPHKVIDDNNSPLIEFEYVEADRQDEKLSKCDVEAELSVCLQRVLFL